MKYVSALGLGCVVAASFFMRPASVVCADDVLPTHGATATAKDKDAEKEDALKAAQEWYAKLSAAYMSNNFEEFTKISRDARLHTRSLTSEQKKSISYSKKSIREFSPKWWKNCGSVRPVSFKAKIWGKTLMCNYKPEQELGVQRIVPRVNQKTGELEGIDIVLSWQPGLINSEEAAEGRLAEIHGLKKGDIAEVIVWHECGHNFISALLPLEHLIDAYTNHLELFKALHEFIADLTAIQHSNPRARRFVFMLRLSGLDYIQPRECHDRAAYAIGCMMLSEWLQNPEKWPSVHFPPSVPKDQVELNTIIYCYEHIAPTWTLQEDMQLRELSERFIKKQGNKMFKTYGKIKLENGLYFNFPNSADTTTEAERQKWVTDQLKKIIKEGRADKLAAGEVYDPPKRGYKRRMEDSINREIERHKKKQDGDKEGADAEEKDDRPLRVELPWPTD